VQRYKCVSCDHQFQSLRRPNRFINRLWEDYVWKKQSLKQLGDSLGRSMKWVRTKLDEVDQRENPINPSSVVIIADTTFWGRSYGVCVFRSPSLKRNIWWHEVESEKVAHYYYGRKILEERGWKFIGAVVDGRRGLTRVFGDIPVQICQFHQIKRVTNYLTRKPETLAGVELRELTLTLSRTIEKVFSKALESWHKKWKTFIEKKTRVQGCNRWHYTHKNVLGAYKSLERNLPYLFTYQKYPELGIPNTTNSLDGMFTQLKSKTNLHRGSRRDRRFKLISEILSGEEN